MKRKRAIFTILCVMVFSLCGFAGAAFAETGTGSSAKTYVAGGGFHASEVESTTPVQAYADASSVTDALFLLNKPVGGETGLQSTLIFDVEFVQETYQFKIGLSRKNVKSEIADAASNYIFYYNDGSAQKPTSMVKGAWNHDATTDIAPLKGEVSLKLEISAYGNVTLSVKIPASNTVMDSKFERDSWLEMYKNIDTSYPFLSFANVDNPSALKEVGYPFFASSNFKLLRASISSQPPISVFENYTENFATPSTFDTNWVTNDAFDTAVAAGTASKPSAGAVSFVESLPNDKGVASGGTSVNGNNMLVSTQSFKGATHVEYVVTSRGPTTAVGFVGTNETAPTDYISLNFNGYSVTKDGNAGSNVKVDGRWDEILKEDEAKFYVTGNMRIFHGKVKFILDVSADGSATLSLRILEQITMGEESGLSTEKDYVLFTETGLFADMVRDGGRFFISVPHNTWGGGTTLLSAQVSTSAEGVLLSDDFSYNNINGNGLALWTASSSTTLTLPAVSEVSFSGEGTLGVKTKLENLDADVVSGAFNFKLTSGAFGAAFGLGTNYAFGENSSYLYLKRDTNGAVLGLRKGEEEPDERAIAGLDLTNPTLVTFRLIGATGALEVSVGGKTEIFTLENTDGFVGFFGEGETISATLNYLSLKSNPAAPPTVTVPEMTQGSLGETFNLMPTLSDPSFSVAEILKTFNYTVTKDEEPYAVPNIAEFKPTEIGTYHFVFTVSNPAGQTANVPFDFEVIYGAPTLTVGDTKDWYNGLNPITFAPEADDPLDDADALTIAMEVFAGKEATGTPLHSEGLTFTPTATGFYTVKFSVKNTHDLTATAQKTFRVIDLPQMADASAAFDGSDKFESVAGTVADGKLTLGANGMFGTAGWARNYAQMVRITSISETCTDISLYFGRLDSEDTLADACTVTFTKGSTKATVKDGAEERTVELGVDVFAAIGDGSLVVQTTVMGEKLQIALMYGDLPYDVLNEPVAEFAVECAVPGRVGVATVSGGIALDRFVFVNLSDYSEIPDDVVPPDPEEPEEPDDPNKPEEPEKGGCGGCGSTGGIGGMLGGGLAVIALAAFGLFYTRKRIK